MNSKPIPIQPIIPVRQPTPAEQQCRDALRQDARTHIGRLFK